MITLNKRGDEYNYNVFEIMSLSTDNRPTEIDGVAIPNGSVLYCMDTGDCYMFDVASQTWLQQ